MKVCMELQSYFFDVFFFYEGARMEKDMWSLLGCLAEDIQKGVAEFFLELFFPMNCDMMVFEWRIRWRGIVGQLHRGWGEDRHTQRILYGAMGQIRNITLSTSAIKNARF